MMTMPGGRPERTVSGGIGPSTTSVVAPRAVNADKAPPFPTNASGRAYTATASSGLGSESASLSGSTQFNAVSSRSAPATTRAPDMSDSSSSPCTVMRPLPLGNCVI